VADKEKISFQMGGQNWFESGLIGIYLLMHLTDWLLIEVALLLIGLIRISLTKSSLTTRL
jgi:hypothetical protein